MTTLQSICNSVIEAAGKSVLIKPVPFYDGYYACSDGNIYSVNSRWGGFRKLASFENAHGYFQLKAISNGKLKRASVHRMVCLAWHGIPAPGLEVRHLDGKKSNNAPTNLIWGTRSENAQDRVRHGTDKGAENGKKSAHKLIKNFCVRGHARTKKNLTKKSSCRTCENASKRKLRAIRNKALSNSRKIEIS